MVVHGFVVLVLGKCKLGKQYIRVKDIVESTMCCTFGLKDLRLLLHVKTEKDKSCSKVITFWDPFYNVALSLLSCCDTK